MGRLVSSFLIILSFLSSAVAAEVVVEGTSAIEGSGAGVKVEGNKVIERLEMLPGVNVVSLSADPTPRDQLRLRGFSPERVGVFLDQFPLNGSGIRGNFYLDLSTVDPMNLSSVEVIYGPSVIYGNNPGGTVVFRSRGIPLSSHLEIKTSTGSYNTKRGNLTYRAGNGIRGISFTVSGGSSDGYLRNDFYERFFGQVDYYYMLDESTMVRLYLDRTRLKDGLPVLNTPKVDSYDDDYPIVEETYFSLACAPYCKLNLIYKDGDNYIKRITTRKGLELLKELEAGSFEFVVYENESVKEESYYGFFKTPAGKRLMELKFSGKDDRTYGGRFIGEFESFFGTVRLGGEFQSSGYGAIKKNGLPFISANYNALRRYAAFGEVERRTSVFGLRAGIRAEKWRGSVAGVPDPDGVEFLPSFTLSFGKRGVTFFLGAGRVYRPPRAEELLWYGKEYGKLSSAGYSLKAEEGWDYEVGFRWKLKRGVVSLRGFRYDLDNFIVSNFEAAEKILGEGFPHRIIENLDYYKVNGLEVTGNLLLGRSWGFYTAYSFRNSKFSSSKFTPESTPDPSVLVPKHKLTLEISKLRIFGRDKLTITGIFYSKRKGLKGNLSGFGVFDLGYKLAPTERLSFDFGINNLFNRKYYFVENYQMPGRNYQVSMAVKF